jgi:hypothetical protein
MDCRAQCAAGNGSVHSAEGELDCCQFIILHTAVQELAHRSTALPPLTWNLQGYTTTAAKITAQLLSSVTKFALQVS